MFLKPKLPRNCIKKAAAISGLFFLAIVVTHDDGVPESLTNDQRSEVIDWCSQMETLLRNRNEAIRDMQEHRQYETEALLPLIEKTEQINRLIEKAWPDPTYSYIDDELRINFGGVLIELREFEKVSNSFARDVALQRASGIYDEKSYVALSEALEWNSNNRPNHCHLKPCFLCRSQSYLWKRLGLE